MLYYRVIRGDVFDYSTEWTTIEGELLTQHERWTRFPRIKNRVFELVVVKRTDTYFFFGSRYADEENIKIYQEVH